MTSYYDDHPHEYETVDDTGRHDEYRRLSGTTISINTIRDGYPNTSSREGLVECKSLYSPNAFVLN